MPARNSLSVLRILIMLEKSVRDRLAMTRGFLTCRYRTRNITLLTLMFAATMFTLPETAFDQTRGAKSLTVEQERALKPKNSFKECNRCPVMVVVPAGEFMMGSPETESGHDARESPQHKVTIARNFAVAKFEVTFVEWKACVDARVCEDVSSWGRGNWPVTHVSWNDVQKYVKWLSERTDKPYRLLTEAEWEYAARAQTTAGESLRFSFGDDAAKLGQYAWYSQNSWVGKTRPKTKLEILDALRHTSREVGKKRPNAFGLYDMHGNVWEWVEDCYNDNYNGAPTDGMARTDGDCSTHIIRGGAWASEPQHLRSATRGRATADTREAADIGFRLARPLGP